MLLSFIRKAYVQPQRQIAPCPFLSHELPSHRPTPALPSGTNGLTFLISQGEGLNIPRRFFAASALVLLAASTVHGASTYQAPAQPAEPKPRPDLVRQPYSQADIDFMSGMIPHHAQAVLIAGWAASHGARDDVRKLCERQVVAQRDEIEFMRNWLRDRGEPVPAANATHHRMKMNGVEHDMLMPGMLTPEQLAELDKARGSDWDRLFLRAMIRHHEGAIKMVDDLFGSYGAMQDDDVYKFASDIYADQSTEIERMQKMLDGIEKR
jgi:uncharacterized protein (DUF305 family)